MRRVPRVPAGPVGKAAATGFGAVRRRSYDPAHPRPGRVRDGDGEARSRGTAADRGGGRLVRVPRGDGRLVGNSLWRGRAVGRGPAHAADAGDQGPAGKAAARGRLTGGEMWQGYP